MHQKQLNVDHQEIMYCLIGKSVVFCSDVSSTSTFSSLFSITINRIKHFFLSASNQALQQWIQIRFCFSGFLQQHICHAYTQFNFCDVAIFCNSRCTIFPHLECIFPCGSILLLEPRNKFAVGDNIKRLFFDLCVTQLI